MSPGLGAALRCELLKARRSRLPPLVFLGFSLAPIMAGLFMVIMKDPARARRWGLVSAKAQLVAGAADWETFLGVIAQAVAVGGMLLFALIVAWVFGRELAERTARNLLAVPTSRTATVLAKLLVSAGLCAALTTWVFLLGLAIGAAVGLPGGSPGTILAAAARTGVAALLTISLLTPVAFLAGVGRGYMAPLGFAILTLFLAQIVAATGWGSWFPWSVAPLLAGLAGPAAASLGPLSYALVLATSAAGLAATLRWWNDADHTT